jgi:hypothetical protein
MKKKIISILSLICISTVFGSVCSGDLYTYLNKELKRVSNNKYSLTFTIFRDKYYINGDKYIEVPKLSNGLYLYYTKNSQYPHLSYLDNRENNDKRYKGLPIPFVKEIFIYDDRIVLYNESMNVIYFDNNQITKIVTEEKNRDILIDKKVLQHIKIKPVIWVDNNLIQNTEQFWGINDNEFSKKYKTEVTPKLTAITKVGIQKVYEKNKPKYYLLGETPYSYFRFDIMNGEVEYLDEESYFKSLDLSFRHGHTYFISGPYEYLTRKKLEGLTKEEVFEYQ